MTSMVVSEGNYVNMLASVAENPRRSTYFLYLPVLQQKMDAFINIIDLMLGAIFLIFRNWKERLDLLQMQWYRKYNRTINV